MKQSITSELPVDIAIKQKSKSKLVPVLLGIALISVLGYCVSWLWELSQAEDSISRETLTFGEVKRGKFSVSVRGNGVLVPEHIQWLSVSIEAAKVEKVLVKPGNIVKQGELIVELSNPQLVKRLHEQQWELEAMLAEAQAAKVSEESRFLEHKAEELNARLNYQSSLLKHTAEAELMDQNNGAVSRLTFERTQLETEQFKQRWEISQQRLDKMQENIDAQGNARKARHQKAQKLLESLQQQVEELQVRASMDSVILDVPVEAGQRIGTGTNIAKLAQQKQLLAELQVPEIQVSDVLVGQLVELDTRNNIIQGIVARIEPSVINGNVQVDVEIKSPLPEDARPDLSVSAEIKIAELDSTLYVDRPLFAQSQSQAAFYKVNAEENMAVRVELSLGVGSTNQIQVLEGLVPGDRIIISDPAQFERFQKFRIN